MLRKKKRLSHIWVKSELNLTSSLISFNHYAENSLTFNLVQSYQSWYACNRISIYEANDIIVFIKYMYQQHDIKIKIHNDMIQMLKDVNEINIMLKEQLKTQQTSLQKEIKNKNVIIHHLKIILNQQNFFAFKNWTLKSIKLSNSLLFEDSMQNVNNWLSWMQNKLKINKNHFSIKKLKIVYIKSWVSEATIKHIALQMRNMSLNFFLEVEEVLLIINKMYDDFNHHHTT